MISSGKPLRAGLIGVGTHAREVLIPGINQIPDDLRLVALASAHESTAKAASEFHRLPCHVGYEKLIADPNVEAVIIASSGDHESVAIAALDAGKPVFNETPAIRSEAGGARIKRLAAEKKLTYLVGSCLRYAPVYRKMRLLLGAWREREPGARTFNAAYYFGRGHFCNLMLYLGGPIDSALHQAAPEGAGGITLLRFASGDIGSIRECAFNNWTPPYEQMEIVHKSGWMLADDGRILKFHQTSQTLHPMRMSFDNASGDFYQTTFSLPYGQSQHLHLRGYIPELSEFAHCVRTGERPSCGVDDALATLRVDEATRQSRDSGGQWVKIQI